jgi:hypothetical protein
VAPQSRELGAARRVDGAGAQPDRSVSAAT